MQPPNGIPPRTHWLHGRFRSFGFALRGLVVLLRREGNMQFHLAATLFVVIMGAVRHISSSKWIMLIIIIGIVWITETLNTAIERLCDLYSTDYNPLIKIIKDMAAGAVLVASVISVIAGILIFFF